MIVINFNYPLAKSRSAIGESFQYYLIPICWDSHDLIWIR